MRIVSWNVNGIRAVLRSGFRSWLAADQADIVCLQETRIPHDKLGPDLLWMDGYQGVWHSAERRGYSGVATLSRTSPLAVRFGTGLSEFDQEGRVLISEYPAFTLVNAYFPSGRRGQERVAFKLRFTDTLLGLCLDLRREGHSLVICGDFNTAHQPLDLARPRQNQRTSGFLPEERRAFDDWLAAGFVDAYRHLHPGAVAYTWWSNLFDSRARNVGWRIDYFLVAKELLGHVVASDTLPHVAGSDHCPIALDITFG